MSARTVWFHRDYQRFTGGHVKHAHYFDHVRRAQGFEPRMTFSGAPATAALAEERRRLWLAEADHVPDWRPAEHDILFVAGTDWRYLDARGFGRLRNPRINLVQHVRHAHAATELYGYLGRRAVRICVSEEVADAIRATGRVNGPVLTIPNGIDTPARQRRSGRANTRTHAVVIIGYKNTAVARALSARLEARGVGHEMVLDFLDRDVFLDLLGDTETAICLPRAQEGFYLPALEAMAACCTVVTMDCIGNRGFCRHGENCLIGHDAESLARAVEWARDMPPETRRRMQANADETVAAHALSVERARFHAVLGEIDSLWRRDGPQPLPPVRQGQAKTPLVDFVIVGAQKCGTTALGLFLARHPEIGMSSQKEVHLFDQPDYAPGTTAAEIDARYRRYFAHVDDARIRGEATPIYMYLPGVATELKRYNPDLKLIVLLRDPVERALSAYYMQTARARETKPLWLALLLESWRLRRDRDVRGSRSPTREHGYRSRGLYSLQLRELYRHFDRDRILIVRCDDLRDDHDATLQRVLAFLGVSTAVRIPPEIVFRGQDRRPHRLCRALLKLSYAAEFRRQRLLGVP